MGVILGFNTTTGTVTQIDRSATEVILTTYNSNPIKKIGKRACFEGKVVTLDLQGTVVVDIDDEAFFNCSSLKTVLLPTSLIRIGGNTLFAARIDELFLPENVRSISGYFINQNKGKTLFTVDTNNQYFSAEAGFLYNKNKTTLVRCTTPTISSEDIPYIRTLKTIGEYAFTSTKIQTFVGYPDLEILRTHAFHAMGMITTIDLSKTNVKEISDRCFWGCSVSDLILPKTLQSIREKGFQGSHYIKTLVLSYEVTQIDDNAFLDCQRLTKIFYFGSAVNLNYVEMFTGVTPKNRIKIYVTEFYTESTFGNVTAIHSWYLKGQKTCKNKDLAIRCRFGFFALIVLT